MPEEEKMVRFDMTPTDARELLEVVNDSGAPEAFCTRFAERVRDGGIWDRPTNTIHEGLQELMISMYEISALHGLRAGTDHDEAPEGVKHLAPNEQALLVSELAEAFGSYASCVSEEKCWSPETFAGLMTGVRKALIKAFGENPDAEGDFVWCEPEQLAELRKFAGQFNR